MTERPQRTERAVPSSLLSPAPMRSRIPLRRGETTVLAAPLCHPWGFLHLKLALRLGSTLVLRHRFDPARAMQDIAENDATALALLPDMLKEIMAMGPEAIRNYGTGSLELIAISGRSVPQELALPAIQTFGEVLYNLQGPSIVKLNGHWIDVNRDTSAAHMRRRRSAFTPAAAHARRGHA